MSSESEPAVSTIAHAVPGRIRLKIDRIRNDPAYRDDLENTLAGVSGIDSVSTNPTTGSLLVIFDPKLTEAISASLFELGIAPNGETAEEVERWMKETETSGPIIGPSSLASLFEGITGTIDRTLMRSTKGRADLRSVIPLELLFAGGTRFVTGDRAAPPWYMLVWFAFSSYMSLRNEKPAGDLDPNRTVE